MIHSKESYSGVQSLDLTDHMTRSSSVLFKFRSCLSVSGILLPSARTALAIWHYLAIRLLLRVIIPSFRLTSAARRHPSQVECQSLAAKDKPRHVPVLLRILNFPPDHSPTVRLVPALTRRAPCQASIHSVPRYLYPAAQTGFLCGAVSYHPPNLSMPQSHGRLG